MFPDQIARRRIDKSSDEIRNSLRMIANGNPLGAETDLTRLRDRIQAKKNLDPGMASMVSHGIAERAEAIRAGGKVPGPELVQGDTIDFLDVAFLARGARVARSVGRVSRISDGRAQGSGVLIGAGLFLTNAHVIKTAAQAGGFLLEFDFERDEEGHRRRESRFVVDPSVFASDGVDGLDYTIVAVGRPFRDAVEPLETFGTSPLSDASDKHMIGEFANIVQHPQGRLKEVVLRENRLVSRFDDFLHYIADTEKGSSGSPVYNSEWQMIGLHHWGGPQGELADPRVPGSDRVNEGIRASSIVRHLRATMELKDAATRARLEEALSGGSEGRDPGRAGGVTPPVWTGQGGPIRLDAGGTATWVVPVEVSVRVPGPVVWSAAPPDRPVPAGPPGPDEGGGEGRDDPRRIRGVGPVLAEALEAAGMASLTKLAAMDGPRARALGEAIGHPGRPKRQDWAGQARKLLDGD